MKLRLLLFACCWCAALTVWSGSGDFYVDKAIGSTKNPSSIKTYRITETFDSGNKGSYETADVALQTGSWKFTNALLGGLKSDVKVGEKSVRLKNGSIEMNFDILGLKMLYIHHAKYSNDGTAKWQLLMSVNGAGYKKIGEDIVENNSTLKLDSFAIKTSGRVRFKIVNNSSERINIDEITFRGVGNSGLGIGKTENETGAAISTSTSATAGRDVIAGFDAPPFTGENGNIYLGNPSNAKPDTLYADNYLIDHKYYVVSYSRSRAIPNWVSWHVDASNLGTADRRNNFAAWSGLPSGWYQVQSDSYSYSTFGFDRGHNCPSADRTSSAEANSSTFLMTNMIPQASANNQQVWGNFEDYLRSQVIAGNEVYVIMGNYGSGGTSAKGTYIKINNITVPSHIWKVAVILPAGSNDLNRINSDTRVIAINTPNTNTVCPDWRQYIVTVRSIEAVTKLNILSNLPQKVQDVLENRKDLGE